MSPSVQGDAGGILGDAPAKSQNFLSLRTSQEMPAGSADGKPEPSTGSRTASVPADQPTSPSADDSIKDEKMLEVLPAYETRSRNRPGASRPNYAEDFDDFELRAPQKLQLVPSKRASPADAPLKESGSAANSATSRNDQLPVHGSKGGIIPSVEKPSSALLADSSEPQRKKRKSGHTAASKEATPSVNIPGTSSFSTATPAAENAPASRKRKAPEATRGSAKNAIASGVQNAGVKQNGPAGSRRNCIVTFEKTGARVNKHGKLKSDDGEEYAVDDHIYGVCEPPGEPYYLARIMQFRHAVPEDTNSPVKFFLVNWFYRPKEISKYSIDSRLLFASMHSDEMPVTSLRGKCRITHKSDIPDLDEYRKVPNSFWFSQMYDRYIQKPYDLIPAREVKNVPEKIKRAVDERWKFLIVEAQRYKEFTSDVKTCKKCSKYCAPNELVECGVCRDNYHMACVKLERKPTRGFAWSCLPCSLAHDRKEQVSVTGASDQELEREEEVVDENVQDMAADETDKIAASQEDDYQGNQAEIAYAGLWHWRYLGIHCAIEDVLQYDDRAIYPRAASRQGPKYQASVGQWFGQPVQLIKPSETKKKLKGAQAKKDAKAAKEAAAALEKEKQERLNRPKWVQDEPSGYVARGEDYDEDDPRCTAIPISVIPPKQPSRPSGGFSAVNAPVAKDPSEMMENYMNVSQKMALSRGAADPLNPRNISTNYLDRALYLLTKHKFDTTAALAELRAHHTAKDLGNPEFTKEEQKRFEDGVRKHGSDLRLVRKQVKSKSHGEIVRHYYTWKWTARGKEVWGNYEGRGRSKKASEASWPLLADDEDDSAFDGHKAVSLKQRFQCKFCQTTSSKQWRRAPMVQPGQTVFADPSSKANNKEKLALALCERCAVAWRRYAVQYTDLDELLKSMTQVGGRAWKRKTEEDLLRELLYANFMAGVPVSTPVAKMAATLGCQYLEVAPELPQSKKAKATDKDAPATAAVVEKKKPAPPAQPPPPREPTPPPVPDQPKLRTHPCSVCLNSASRPTDQLLCCKECRLHVHRRCYGVSESTRVEKWACDTCLNDKNNQHSFNYECVLCPMANRKPDLIEPLKPGPKKKTDRDREKERMEKELAAKLLESFKKSQSERRRPVHPREALKPTFLHNWVHITCAVWHQEIKFRDSDRLDVAEGIGSVLVSTGRTEAICKLCNKQVGATTSCLQCHTPFHVECAHDAGYHFGFDVTPVKSSRKDSVVSVAVNGESGFMSPAIWCKEHQIKGVYHPMNEIVKDSGLTAFQQYVQTYKQADLSLAGTARKANLLLQSAKAQSGPGSLTDNRRRSSVLTNGASTAKNRRSPPPELDENGPETLPVADKQSCHNCGTSVSPRFHKLDPKQSDAKSPHLNGTSSADTTQTVSDAGAEVQNVLWQCHKCFMGPRTGIESVRSNLKDEKEQDASSAPDYFDIMFPGCRQAPAISYRQPSTAHEISMVPQRQSTGPLLGNSGTAELRRLEKTLWACEIVLTNLDHPAHPTHKIFGREFGSLEKTATVQYNDVMVKAKRFCEFDSKYQLIRTDSDIVVDSWEKLIPALSELIETGPRTAHWTIYQNPDVPRYTNPAVALYSYGPHSMSRGHGYHMGPAGHHPHGHPPPPDHSAYPPPHPPALLPLQSTLKFAPSTAPAPHPSPSFHPSRPSNFLDGRTSYLAATPGQGPQIFAQPPPSHASPPATSMSPTDRREHPGPMSSRPQPPHAARYVHGTSENGHYPPHASLGRPVTPKEAAAAGQSGSSNGPNSGAANGVHNGQSLAPPFSAGASSSPNLKNLVH